MGIADRSYMRGRRPAGDRLSATVWTLGVLVGFFILTIVLRMPGRGDWLDWTVLSKGDLSPWKWITYALPHGDLPSRADLMAAFWHLLGNCLIIWWTGSIVETEYGPKVFWWTISGGVISGAAFWYLTGLGGVAESHIVGISAAGYALMMVALLNKLEHRITLLLFFFLPVMVKVRWLLILLSLFALCGWAFSELPGRHTWPLWRDLFDSNIAHSAHLGGLIFGWFAFRRLNQTNLTVQDAQEEVVPPPPSALEPDVVRYDDEETAAVAPLTRQQARAELDLLLDKISAQGFGSLSESDKRRLEELSARLR